MSIENYTKRLQRAPVFLILMALAGFAGLKDYAALLIPEKFALTLTLSIFAIGLVVIKWRHGGVRETITKPHTANLFAPFLPADESSAEKQWPRYTEVEELRSLVSKSNLKHVSLVGETGVGKSTIISQLTTKLGPLNTIVFSNYSEISRGIVDGMFDLTPTAAKGALLTEKAMLIACIEEASKRTELTTQRAFDRGHTDIGLDTLSAELLQFLDTCTLGKPAKDSTILIVFDQYERHLQLMRDIPGSSGPRSELVDWYLFRKIINGLRIRPQFRTMFSVRSDCLLQSIISTYPCETEPNHKSPDFSDYWSLKICHGVNAYSSVEAYAAVRASLSKLKLSASDLENFERATGLKSEQFSNTFLVQLSGYLIEHYWEVDNLRLRRLLSEDTEKIAPVRLLFDYIENDFINEGHSTSRFELLKAVLFTVAIENRSTGTTAPLERIAALSHLSQDEIRPQLDYLCSWGVVLEERQVSGRLSFRVGHDLIGDYVIDHERLSAGSRFKDAIQSLSYLRARNSSMIRVKSFPSLFGDIGSNTNFGQLLILLYIFLGVVKITFPGFCDVLAATAAEISNSTPSTSCKETLPSFPAIFIMDCVWLNYIYILTRGYLSVTLRTNITRHLSAVLPGLGALLAIVFSQTLQFALIPIFVVGLLLGVVLALGSKTGDFSGNVAEENFRWGYRTMFNMLFAACLMIFAPVFINPGQETVRFFSEAISMSNRIFGITLSSSPVTLSSTTWMFFGGALMTYFCWHISAEQQGRLSIAARLALHDRARADHEKLA